MKKDYSYDAYIRFYTITTNTISTQFLHYRYYVLQYVVLLCCADVLLVHSSSAFCVTDTAVDELCTMLACTLVVKYKCCRSFFIYFGRKNCARRSVVDGDLEWGLLMAPCNL